MRWWKNTAQNIEQIAHSFPLPVLTSFQHMDSLSGLSVTSSVKLMLRRHFAYHLHMNGGGRGLAPALTLTLARAPALTLALVPSSNPSPSPSPSSKPPSPSPSPSSNRSPRLSPSSNPSPSPSPSVCAIESVGGVTGFADIAFSDHRTGSMDGLLTHHI